jgi:hypothetical protein
MKFEKIVFIILTTSFKLAVLFASIDVALILVGKPPLHMVVVGLALTCAVSAFVYGGMIFTGCVDLNDKE